MMSSIQCPTLFNDAKEYFKACEMNFKEQKDLYKEITCLKDLLWGIDFIGPINPSAWRMQDQFNIVAINYLIKWVEAKATWLNDAQKITKFLYEEIFIGHGLPTKIVNDRGTHFINEVIDFLLDEFIFIHNKSATYHPQANGQVESTNKILKIV